MVDQGVRYANSGQPLIKVAATRKRLRKGQYLFRNSLYRFSTRDRKEQLIISYDPEPRLR